MTVCIAAISSRNHIAVASDTQISGWTANIDECMVKDEPFHKEWSAMMAADDITQCPPITERARVYFHNRENTLTVARSSFKRAYQKHLSEMAADEVLGRYNLSMEEFLKDGKRKFTEKRFDLLSSKIDEVRCSCNFLVYGFDRDGSPHIFTVQNPGIDAVYDSPGFCAIGSGGDTAQGMLFYLGQKRTNSLEQTVFNVCAAKFAAERIGVGTHTYLFVKKLGSVAFSHRADLLDSIRSTWDSHGAPRVPQGIVGDIFKSGLRFVESGQSISSIISPKDQT